MKIYDAYKMAIETGMRNDPRSAEEVKAVLRNAKEEYQAMSKDAKEFFDKERLWNPYADSRMCCGRDAAKETEAVRFMWGIDIGTGEVLLADRLREKGQEVSAVVSHHPVGMSKTPFPEVMWMQADMYHSMGIPINVAEGMLKGRIDEVSRNVMGSNYNQSVDAARMLGFPMFNIHTPADNMVQGYMDRMFDDAQPKYVEDIIALLMKEPEYRQASKYNDPPKIILGGRRSRCGKVVSKMTGGTSGPKEIYDKMAQAGVGTVVGMHFPENHVEEARKHNINMVIAGHMASDSVGINMICDVWEKKGIEVAGFSGFMRFSRN